MTARTALPTRRNNRTVTVEHEGREVAVCIGFEGAWRPGPPREVFADTSQPGSAMQAFVADACIILSVALQYGVPPEALAHSLGKVPAHHGGKATEAHASPIGAIVEAIIAETPR